MTRYWSTHRPISIGTYPKEYGVIEIVNTDYTYVPEIGRNAFGYIDYERELPKSEQDHYDLRPEVKVDPELEKLAGFWAKAAMRGNMQVMGKVMDKAFSENLIESEDELVEAAAKYFNEDD